MQSGGDLDGQVKPVETVVKDDPITIPLIAGSDKGSFLTSCNAFIPDTPVCSLEPLKYGSIYIPKGTFRNGWTVRVTPTGNNVSLYKTSEQQMTNQTKSLLGIEKETFDSSSGDGCSSSDSAAVRTISFDINVYDKNGRKQHVDNLPGIYFFHLISYNSY